MPLLLKEPGLQKRTMPLSVKAWHHMIADGLAPEKSELLRGAIVEKMPKSILHIQLVIRLFQLLQTILGKHFWVRPEASLTLADSEPEPDISVVPGKDTDYQSHPTTAKLVIEVSVSTLAEDRELAAIYAEAGVDEYWILDATERAIEIHREPVGGTYRAVVTRRLGESAECLALPQVKVDIAQLFEGLGS